jgi:hypothetical protein
MNYDKPRTTSTVIIGVFLLINIVLAIMLYPVWWSTISVGDTDPAAAPIVALFAGFGVIFVLLIFIVIAVVSLFLFILSLNNRKSTLKQIRIISIVLDSLTGALLLASIIKIILLAIGI